MTRTVPGMHVATVPTLADVLALCAALDSRADALWAHLQSAASVISETEFATAVAERDEVIGRLRPVRQGVDEMLEAGELPAEADLVHLEAALRVAVADADAAAEKFRRYGEVKAGTEHVAGRVAEGLHQLTSAAAALPEHQRTSWGRIAADGYESLQHAADIANQRQWVAALDLLTSLEAQVQTALEDLRIGAPASTSTAPQEPPVIATAHDESGDMAGAAAAPQAAQDPAQDTARVAEDTPTADQLEAEAAHLRAEGSEVVAEFTRLRAHVADAVAAGWENQLRSAAIIIMPGAAASAWAQNPRHAAAQVEEAAQTLTGIRKALAQVATYEDGS